jgi:hypothetical protein
MRRRKVGARKTYRTCVVRTRHVRHIYMLNVYVYTCSVRATEGTCVCCVKKADAEMDILISASSNGPDVRGTNVPRTQCELFRIVSMCLIAAYTHQTGV